MQDDVYEAEVLPDSESTTLNITLGATLAFSIAFLLLSTNITLEIDENASLESVANGGRFLCRTGTKWTWI